jgi:hypothetical protein
MRGNHEKEIIQHSEHGESLKSRISKLPEEGVATPKGVGTFVI